jgi:hypothetical protein
MQSAHAVMHYSHGVIVEIAVMCTVQQLLIGQSKVRYVHCNGTQNAISSNVRK